jgi:hypothetical protein
VQLTIVNGGKLGHDLESSMPVLDFAYQHSDNPPDEQQANAAQDVIDIDYHAGHNAKVTFVPTTPGTYPFFCSLPGHQDAGMQGVFVVSAARGGKALDVAQGQSAKLKTPPGSTTMGFSQIMTFVYPGDNSVVTFDAQIDGLNPGNAQNAGFNVYDAENGSTAVQTVTPANNAKNQVPGSVEFSYQSSTARTVAIQFFNWNQVPATMTITPVALPQGSTLHIVPAAGIQATLLK